MLGNDVVDLSDPESFASALHPRFDARVFSTQEIVALAQSANSNELRWSLWAAKESAYKLLCNNGKVIFSPSKFCVQLDAQTQRVGAVQYEKMTLPVRMLSVYSPADTETCIALHAVCTGSGQTADAWISGVVEIAALQQGGEPSLTPSAAVRRLAMQVAAREFDLDPTLLCVGRSDLKIPYFEYAGERLPISLSLAHHGRFVAFACTRPRAALTHGRAA